MPQEGLQVTTYNLLANSIVQQWPDSHPEIARDWNTRRQQLLDHVASFGSHVICLQEVDKSFFDTGLQPLLAKQGYQGYYTPATSKHDWGIATFQKLGKLPCAVHSFQHERRPAHILRFGQFGVIGAYLRWSEDDKIAKEKIQELINIIEKEPDRKWVICGDFNVHPKSPPTLPLLDADFNEILDWETTPTCTPLKGAPYRPDHVYHSNGLRAEVEPIPVVLGSIHSKAHPSDHLPITATFWTE